jgi:signal transduction histidine kinase
MAVIPRAASTSARSGLAFGPFAYLVFAFLALCAIVTIVGSKDAADAAGALGVMAGAGLSGTLFLVRSRVLDGRERLGWSLVGVGLLIAALGVLVVGIVFFVRGDAPAFGWTDLFFLSTYVVIVAGFAALPQTQGTPLQRWRMVLDGLIGAVSVAALMWVFFLSDLMTDLADTSLTAKVIGGFYPFLDVVAITVAMSVLLRRSRHRFDIRLALFTVGIFFQVLGDLAFFVSGHAGSFDDAEPLYVINLIAVAFFFASASLIGLPTAGREYADRNPPLWTQVAPYIPAVGMLLVFLGRAFVGDDPEIDPILLASTIVVGLLVIARQGVAIIENRAYIEQQRNALVSTISHELRTPLTAIVGFVELLQEDDAVMHDDERQGMLTIVHQQADYMSRIVSDLIMLARDSGGEMRLDVQPVRITDLATASVHAAGVQPSSIEIQCPRDLVAFVDPGRMQQVLVNLITNASRYGGQHRLLRAEVDGADLTFSVHDDGAGIPRRYEVRVWDRFERGPNRLNASVPGSGIGLAIVRAIAEAHGGTATYTTSDVLGGACFVVRLPGRVTSVPHSGMDAAADTTARSTT